MDDRNPEDRPRASLRGKGREILLGDSHSADAQRQGRSAPEHGAGADSGTGAELPDAAALSLTPEETQALLNFDADAALFDPDFSVPGPDTALPDLRSDPVDEVQLDAAPGDDFDAGAAHPTMDWLREDTGDAYGAVADDTPPGPEAFSPPEPDAELALDWLYDDTPDMLLDEAALVEGTAPYLSEALNESPAVSVRSDDDELEAEFVGPETTYTLDGLPLAERPLDQVLAAPDQPYTLRPEVEDLTPQRAEQWSQVAAPDEPDIPTSRDIFQRVAARREARQDALVPPHAGGSAVAADEVPSGGAAPDSGALDTVKDPFTPPVARAAADQLFRETGRPDGSLLASLVDEDRIRRLWAQIDALHEELVQTVKSDRADTDVYQQELLQASGMLLESRANYDDARAIVYRLRADLNRQRKVEADIRRYRPLLLNYYIGWGIALVVLFFLRELFSGVAEAVGVDVVGALYFPTLLGISGALVSGFMTLERHTTRLRDFDPLHISWYLFNPLLGGVMGILMFLLASVANEDLLRQAATDGEVTITYLLCVIAGMNQNNVLRRLNELIKRFNPGTA